MVDLAPALDLASRIVMDALRTVGTTVTLTRSGPATTVNLDTLAVTAPGSTQLGTAIPAIVSYPNLGSHLQVYPGSTEAADPSVPIILPPTLTDVLRGDTITVDVSRDPRMVGMSFEVVNVLGTSAGAARQVTAKIIPKSGQA